MKVEDFSYMNGKRARGHIHKRNGYHDGVVDTQYGAVYVYAQGDDEHAQVTRLDFNHRGRIYVRNFTGKRYTPRGMAKKANEFAREVTGLNQS